MKILAEVLAVCVFGTLAFTATSHAAASPAAPIGVTR